jgi:hypothetical protein
MSCAYGRRPPFWPGKFAVEEFSFEVDTPGALMISGIKRTAPEAKSKAVISNDDDDE